MQRPPHLVPGLRSQPWWDKRAFPWCALLERNYAAIRAEVRDATDTILTRAKASSAAPAFAATWPAC